MKRHTNRDKNMKGFVDHAVVKKRIPLPECPPTRPAKLVRNGRHGGMWCVREYTWCGFTSFSPTSLQAALRDIQGVLAKTFPDMYGADRYHGLPDGMPYEVAKDLIRVLKRSV